MQASQLSPNDPRAYSLLGELDLYFLNNPNAGDAER